MSNYLDAGQFKKTRNGKWQWTPLGYAKQNDKGQWDIYLNALPLPDSEGSCRITLKERQKREGGYPDHTGTTGGASGDVDDHVPF